MKVCLVLAACMLAVIPATTGLTPGEIQEDLRQWSKPSSMSVPTTLTSVEFKEQNYKSGCDAIVFLGHEVGNTGEILQGKLCTAGDPTKEGFQCTAVTGVTEYRYHPKHTCNSLADCGGTNVECNSDFSFGNVKYCMKQISYRTDTTVSGDQFCPFEQL